jgi:hypothetical protein
VAERKEGERDVPVGGVEEEEFYIREEYQI